MNDIKPIELEKLKKDIQNNTISIEYISNKIGVDQSQISRIINGKYKRKSENFEKLCKFALIHCELDMNELKKAIDERLDLLYKTNDTILLNSIYRLMKSLE